MSMKFTQLHCKEVICLRDGRRLGYVADVCIEIPEGKVAAIIVPCPGKMFGLLAGRDEYMIPWGCIRRVGPDIILVDIAPEDCRCSKPRLGKS